MKMFCCGLVYSTLDPQTYWCIQKYNIKNLTKKTCAGRKVIKEEVFVLICKKNGCTKLELHRYASSDEKDLIEKECYSGRKAIKFLENTKDNRTAVPQKCPFKLVEGARRIPYVYGKVIDSETQRARYFGEEGWASSRLIHSPVKVYKI